ncbi:MAG: glucoamylase family protein [bacterium]|nr:glucoamylase family protein [bacterium]
MKSTRQRDPGRRHLRAATFVAALAAAVLLAAVPAAWALTTPALLDTLQHTAFDYFWEEASAGSGLIKDGSQDWSVCSIAAQGFGYSAYCVAVDHGWVTRAAARDRIIRGLETLWSVPQGTAATNVNGYKGLYYHFLDLNTGVRTWDCELSSIDTALLIAGVLDAKEYFDAPDEPETHLRALADSIYYRVDWDFMRNGGNGIRMGWKPGTGFAGYGDWVGYNEAMILYILAIGSPTHPVPAWTWNFWTLGYWWGTQYGQTYVIFPPLFGHQYSHCWIDFRQIQDAYMRNRGITYHENSRRATLAARAYCIANPGGWVGYAGDVWGLTASIDPDGYVAHGAPPGQSDNGTISPTAAGGSIAFAPEIVIPTLHKFWDSFRLALWGEYGFKDAFNLSRFWWAQDYLGIDQGPIIMMIENYRTGSIWERFGGNPDVCRGLELAGFTAATAVAVGDGAAAGLELGQNTPNPCQGTTTVAYSLAQPGRVALSVYDARGRLVRTYIDESQDKGGHQVVLDFEGLPSGAYFYSLESDREKVWKRCILVR